MPLPGTVTPGLTSDAPIAPAGAIEGAMDKPPEELALRVEGVRGTLPEECQEDFDTAIEAAKEHRTRQLQKTWTERLQKSKELERRYEGQDEALQLGQVFKTVRDNNPALAQQAYQLLVSNTIGAQGEAASQQPVGQVAPPSGASPDQDPVKAKFRAILEENPQNPDAYQAIDSVATARSRAEVAKLESQVQDLTAAIQQQQIQQQIQVLHQKEADFLTKNPIFNQQKYIDEVRRRQQTERLPNGQPFITLPPEQQYMAVAQPDLITAMAQQREVNATRPSRAAANIVQMPGHTSPTAPTPPKSEEQAWDDLHMQLGEMPLEAVEGDVY